MVIWGCLSNPSSCLWKVEQRQSNRTAWKMCGQALHRTIFSHSLYINGAGGDISETHCEKHSLSWKGTHCREKRVVLRATVSWESPCPWVWQGRKQTSPRTMQTNQMTAEGYTMSHNSVVLNTGYRENTSTTYLLILSHGPADSISWESPKRSPWYNKFTAP